MFLNIICMNKVIVFIPFMTSCQNRFLFSFITYTVGWSDFPFLRFSKIGTCHCYRLAIFKKKNSKKLANFSFLINHRDLKKYFFFLVCGNLPFRSKNNCQKKFKMRICFVLLFFLLAKKIFDLKIV